MSTPPEPHTTLAAADIADWLDRQGQGSWWAVDGDALLTGLVSFPCPGDVLAKELRRIGRRIVVLGQSGESEPRRVLDDLALRDEGTNDRLFTMRWEGAPEEEEWVLYEDREAAARAAQRRRAAGT
jgi:hypothetical protein